MQQKKMRRRNCIEEVAFKLFCEKGIKQTSIDDIVREADIAKGTFYLYFKNKNQLIDQLVLREATNVLKRSIAKSKDRQRKQDSFENQMIDIVDLIINYFQENPQFLEFIHKNLYRSMFSPETRAPIIELIKTSLDLTDDSNNDLLQKKLYLILELVGSVIYNAIILKEPYKIDEIKPTLYQTVEFIIIMKEGNNIETNS
ncbi:MAG: hypothetical protein CSA13_01895 [Clostridiales bacterium]|nr:MAG: hypothetical protein CSA13_01895 [Clostridiales bacterium]